MSRYIFSEHDKVLMAAADQLLDKVIAADFLLPAQLISVFKLKEILRRAPNVVEGINVKLTVSGPLSEFGDIETQYYWDIEIEGGILGLNSGGSLSCLGPVTDSFTTMIWNISTGAQSGFIDYLNHHNHVVPDIKCFEDAVRNMDFSFEQYSIEITDRNNPLLKDCSESADFEDDYCEDPEDDLFSDWVVNPLDEDEEKLASIIIQDEVDRRGPVFAYGVENCAVCKCSLDKCGLYVEGFEPISEWWTFFCATCFFSWNDLGLGWGLGQLYARQPNGDWRCVAGFEPGNEEDEENIRLK